LPPDTAIAVFRVFQESLTNIARHAAATAVAVHIEVRDRVAVVAIQDNGCGFDLEAAGQKRSLGLAGMRERVQAFGGALAIQSRPSHGTTVQVQIPIAAPNSL
jgi:two-component system sensor kinase